MKKRLLTLFFLLLVFSMARGEDNYYVMIATAYSWTGNRTATGVYPDEGMIAVDPEVLKLGSWVHVEHYGKARCIDTGGDIRGHRIDVYFNTQEEAIKWGVKKVKVKIL